MPRSVRSPRFRDLVRELRRLRKEFLPKRFDPTGSYINPRVFTRTLGYRILAHAEIESYLEDRVSDLAQRAVNEFLNSGKVNRVIASLLAFSGQTYKDPPEQMAPPPGKNLVDWNQQILLESKVQSALNALEWKQRNNNGVVERDILNLLLPVGVRPADIDPLWLTIMNAFGFSRGQVAHSSSLSYKTTSLPDPKTEYLTVNNLLVGLREIDDHLNKLLQ